MDLMAGISSELGVQSLGVLFLHTSKGTSQLAQHKLVIQAKLALLKKQAVAQNMAVNHSEV